MGNYVILRLNEYPGKPLVAFLFKGDVPQGDIRAKFTSVISGGSFQVDFDDQKKPVVTVSGGFKTYRSEGVCNPEQDIPLICQTLPFYDRCKFVTFKNIIGEGPEFRIVCFDVTTTHDDVDGHVGLPDSAGFFSLSREKDGSIKAFVSGKSESIGIGSKPERDALLIEEIFARGN